MTLRKPRQIRRQSKAAISQNRIDKVLSDLLKRVELLERRVIHPLDVLMPSIAQSGQLGRRPKIQIEELLKRRDALISWVEDNWPEIEHGIRQATTTAHLERVLRNAGAGGTYPFQPPFYREPKKFLNELLAFLNSGRFFGNPRNLAGAMAGLPELSWKRSFDLCSAHPSRVSLRPRAIRDYLRRKFPLRLHELLKAETVAEIETILRRSRSKDPNYVALFGYVEHLPQWLRDGESRHNPKI